MEMLRKEVLQSFALSVKAETIVMCVSERKSKEVQKAILAQDVEYQARFEGLAEQVAKLSKPRPLDVESIGEVTTRIASHLAIILPVREKIVEASSPALPPSPLTGGHHISNPSPSPPAENCEEEDG
jgi:hypothetical protein